MDEESRERVGSWSKNGSGSGVGQRGRQVTVWSRAAGAADTQEEEVARYAGAGRPLSEQAEMRGDVRMVLEGSMVAVMEELRVGREGVGGS